MRAHSGVTTRPWPCPTAPASPWVLYASTATVRWISPRWALGAELTE